MAAEKDLRVLLSDGRGWLTEPRKGLLTGLLWKKTTASQVWIAKHLGVKNAANVSRAIHLMALSRLEKKVPDKLKGFVSEKNERKCTLTPSFYPRP